MCPLSSATGTSLVSSSSDCLLWGCTLPLRVWEKGSAGLQSHRQWLAPVVPLGWHRGCFPCLLPCSACPWCEHLPVLLHGLVHYGDLPQAGESPAKLREHRQQGVMHLGILSLASTFSVSSNSHFDPTILSGQACVWDCSAEPNQPFSCRGRFLVTPPWGGCGLQPVSEAVLASGAGPSREQRAETDPPQTLPG